jgi:GNAT superfamily N-acetyltransferase
MHWYQKLNHYFPIEEMKSQEHMEILLSERSDIYHKDEGPNHVLMYAELDDFIFVDYLFVSKKTRGEGLGHQLIDKLKQKGKPIILEVEPVNYEDSDTEKRLRFYKREGFEHAQSIGYKSRSIATNEVHSMEILYWSPFNESEESIFEAMRQAYSMIHSYKDFQMYGEYLQPTDEVLTFDKESNNEDILENI